MEALCEQCGLSPHMARVLLDENPVSGRRKKTEAGGGDTLMLVRAPNRAIRCMGRETLARCRDEMSRAKQQRKKKKKKEEAGGEQEEAKQYSDDQVRKYLLERREAELKQCSTPVAGSGKELEKLSAIRRDFEMIHEFVGHARTPNNYLIFVYYVGPEERGTDGCELTRVENWQPVPRSHLVHFHRDLAQRYATCLRHSAADQRELPDSSTNPAYDPRFILHQWSSTAHGKLHKETLLAQRHLFQRAEKGDYVTRQSEQAGEFPFYCPSESEPPETKPRKKRARQQTTVEDAQRVAALDGYEVRDETYRTVGHREYALMPTLPLPSDARMPMQEMIDLSQRSHYGGQRTDQFYELEPVVMVKAAAIAFNGDAFAKSTVTRLHQRYLKTVDRDQAEPLLEFLLNSPEGRTAIKEATLEYVWSLLLMDQLATSPPEQLERLMKEREAEKFVMLED